MDNPSSTVRKAVCVGDYISLAATAPQEAYMHAQALVLTRLGARLTSGGELPPRFHEHVFRVVPALRYEASETLASRRLSRANSLTGKEMADIEAQTRVEREKNDAVLARLDVEPQPEVLYGAKVQLQHVYSGKFISGQRATAEIQKENLLLTLEDRGSTNSLFTVRPRYAYRSEGDFVYFEDEIVIESVELAPHVIGSSVAPFNSLEPHMCEVSLVEASSVGVGWSVGLYARLPPHEARDYLTAGASMNVRFWHSQARGHLTASADLDKAPLPYVRRAHNDDMNDQRNLSAKALWNFEHASSPAAGGALRWGGGVGAAAPGTGSAAVRIRHVATGRYLAVLPRDSRASKLLKDIERGLVEDEGAEFELTLLDDPGARGEFLLHPIVEPADKRVTMDDCSLRIEHRFERAVSSASTGRSVASCWFHHPNRRLKPKKGPRTAVPEQTPPSLAVCFSEKLYPEARAAAAARRRRGVSRAARSRSRPPPPRRRPARCRARARRTRSTWASRATRRCGTRR